METVNELEIDYSSLIGNNIIRNAGQDGIKVSVLGTSEDDFETDSLQASLQVKQQLSSQALLGDTENGNTYDDYWFF